MRELLRAVLKKKKLLPLIELDEKRGGLTPRQVYQTLARVQQTHR